jgi:NADH:ubiquinone oxidoreductase subunit K
MNNEIIINANNLKMISVDLSWNELSKYVTFFYLK